MSQSNGKKSLSALIPLAALVVLGIILFVYLKNVNNNLVIQEERVKTAWSQVENQYQRRLDLIPNLVRAVQAYAGHERETLQAVIEARARATRASLNADDLNPTALQAFQAAQDGLGGALARLLVTLERYPDLKASEQFSTLQVQLEGTENRIAVERMRFNESARDYNTALRAFPANIVASLFGFAQYPYFKAAAGADRAPQVDFSQ
ncbi:MAG: LemA family protein [Deltaproteobacteria bacterium]|jgi:LemA protein|nr:LemA family protein [Deltaproteobacteria bacterium]